ncbi:hypothetical protein GCM10023220_33870 [Streptomyces ziwulingensis]|uniref:Uncharacterized protein n=1 Tax=Streptomyces ziwulingensis TaxID=1045501 RepID=A0ABP9BYV9_9ACTN
MRRAYRVQWPRSGSGKAASGSYTRRYAAYGTITEDTLGTPAPFPAPGGENLTRPGHGRAGTFPDRPTSVLRAEVILGTGPRADTGRL